MFEITGAGVLIAIAGGSYMALFGYKSLPKYNFIGEQGVVDNKHYIAEAIIPFDSPLIGKTLQDVQFSKKEDYEIIDVIRNDIGNQNGLLLAYKLLKDAFKENSGITSLRTMPLLAGDRLLFKSNLKELMEIKQSIGLAFDNEGNNTGHTVEPVAMRQTKLAEAVINHNSRFIGLSAAKLGLRRSYNCYIVAIHRDRKNITSQFQDIVLEHDDIILLEGTAEDLIRLFEREDIQPLTQTRSIPLDKPRATFAILTLFSVVLLAAFNIMPIAGLALIGAMALIASGCLTAEKAYHSIDWRILMLIFGMLGVSKGLENTGLAKIAIEQLAVIAEPFGPMGILFMVYLSATLITEVMSNNAVAVLLPPLAIGLAQSLGYDPRPFIVAIMFAASASFATPIGYQTNTFVYNVGHYQFKDFLRIGTPMNIVCLIVSMLVIPLFWKF